MLRGIIFDLLRNKKVELRDKIRSKVLNSSSYNTKYFFYNGGLLRYLRKNFEW